MSRIERCFNHHQVLDVSGVVSRTAKVLAALGQMLPSHGCLRELYLQRITPERHMGDDKTTDLSKAWDELFAAARSNRSLRLLDVCRNGLDRHLGLMVHRLAPRREMRIENGIETK